MSLNIAMVGLLSVESLNTPLARTLNKVLNGIEIQSRSIMAEAADRKVCGTAEGIMHPMRVVPWGLSDEASVHMIVR